MTRTVTVIMVSEVPPWTGAQLSDSVISTVSVVEGTRRTTGIETEYTTGDGLTTGTSPR